MTGRHFHQARGNGHGHGHNHFHSRALHIEMEQPVQLETREAMAENGRLWADTISRIVPRENNLDEKPVGGTTTPAIVLGVCIPLGLAIIVLVYLHHRTTVRQRKEDETDKYKSMDFGFEGNTAVKKNKGQNYFAKEKDGNHKMQLSMDMNLSSPYLLPPALHQSRESMNSLAKSLHQDDPYRPVTSYGGSDVASLRSFNKGLDRDSTVSSGKTRPSSDRDPFRNPPPPRRGPSPLQQLPPVAQPPSRRASDEEIPVAPAKNEFRFTDDNPTIPGVPEIQEPPVAASQGSHNARPFSNESANPNNSNVTGPAPLVIDARASQNSTNSRPARKESLPVGSDIVQDYQNFSGHFQVDGPDNDVAHMPHMPAENEYPRSAGLGVPGQDNRRLSVGFRPLPPDDFLESEDPEFRANRIRSFYKEYFEEGVKTDNGKPPPLPQQPAYHEDYDANYLGDTAFFDPDTNAFVMPYAQPVTRRAMTPPPSNRRPMPGPRGPPGPHGPHGHGPHGSMNMPGPRSRPRAGSTMSASRWAAMSPRPDSSASNPRNFNQKPRKPMPPPAALNTLPTPSKLRDDSMALLGSIDFAPPPTFKDVVAGRSQSPVGERKPYMLNTPIHSPLVSAFDETPALPSPHLLRKSGTFTALDFAPPRRFKDPESMSETGSVVSNRSGISSANLSAIRGGAGRVSRLPEDTVFTQASMGDTLKPSWNMRT
ncbi:hypothetical protein F5B19DRAFT_491532 [Rostrohypoxylon terebratum]|nr:hypothetical protein F5B19DRAFT_491532 [Rostrohypoxylon terebratum]